jgi:hypothetical protein
MDCDMTDSRYGVSVLLRKGRQTATQMITSTHVIVTVLMRRVGSNSRQRCKETSSVLDPKRKSKYTRQVDDKP